MDNTSKSNILNCSGPLGEAIVPFLNPARSRVCTFVSMPLGLSWSPKSSGKTLFNALSGTRSRGVHAGCMQTLVVGPPRFRFGGLISLSDALSLSLHSSALESGNARQEKKVAGLGFGGRQQRSSTYLPRVGRLWPASFRNCQTKLLSKSTKPPKTNAFTISSHCTSVICPPYFLWSSDVFVFLITPISLGHHRSCSLSL